ncbi:MAG TPA: class I tRNA ligase family protein [candidate division Zixibacteria bacterium]
MIQVNVKCPHCGKSLMEEAHKIDGYPSVKVFIEHEKKKGVLYLSSLYGSYNIETDVFVPEKKLASFICPHCQKELKSKRACEVCQAPMVPFNFVSGGIIQICSRRGCKKHLVEFEKLEGELSAFYNEYGPFH